MLSATVFYPVRAPWSDVRTYLYIVLFAVGNLLLPQLCHLIPSGGKIFLPIYFFTLVAAYKFGPRVGLATAVLSPVLNAVLFGMPPVAVLPIILIKSTLLAVIASYTATYKKLSLLYVLAVVLGYQATGSAIEWVMDGSFAAATSDFTMGVPGMIIQVFGGWALLKKLAAYEQD